MKRFNDEAVFHIWEPFSTTVANTRNFYILFTQAPGEAEAQCVALVNGDKVYGVGTEDMDALTFGTKVMLRHLTASEAK